MIEFVIERGGRGFVPLGFLRLAFLLSLLCGAADLASAFESPNSRWEIFDRRPLSGIRSSVGRHVLDPGLRNENSGFLTLLPVQTVVSYHQAVGRTFFAEEDGILLADHVWTGTTGGLEFRPGPAWSFQLQMLLSAQEGGPWRGRVEQLYAKWQGQRHQISAGRSVIRWGSGAQGDLLVGRTAPPRWNLGWRTERALTMPWIGGTWTGEAFLAYLDGDDRTIPDPLLHGHRFSWQPTGWFELTGSRTILFGGKDRTGRLTLEDLWEILTVQNENIVGARPPSDSDQRASFSVRVQFPWVSQRVGWLDGMEGYYEYAGEDVVDPPLPSAVAHHNGLTLITHGWTATVDYAETVTGKNRWYHHTIYKEAYFYRDLPIGLPQGGDSRSYWVGIWTPEAPLRLRISRAEQRFGIHSGAEEPRVVWEVAGKLESGPRWVWECSYTGTRRPGPGRDERAPGFLRDQVVLRITRR